MNLEQDVINKVVKAMQRSIDQEVFRAFVDDRTMKIVWQRDDHAPLILYARISYDHGPITQTGLREHNLEPIQDWCMHNRCGRRTSFEQFRFRNEAEMSMFLLRWS